MAFRAGVDTGGTFTDIVAYVEVRGELRMAKALSTPTDPSRAVFDSFARAGLATNEISYFVHGTTPRWHCSSRMDSGTSSTSSVRRARIISTCTG